MDVLEQFTGSLEIDAPSNKSGLQQKEYPEFPKFNSAKESYVFYDKSSIQTCFGCLHWAAHDGLSYLISLVND